ncbi:unnamed protein product [Strongylus vulgaris]|uniref:Uncharacterized protein n=1 Tax=Strongylus vulgaris TaxID=40348 RepID=A0A3P7KMD6_STRVU|nr:unnamed protein product [Strongylus vulgaris]
MPEVYPGLYLSAGYSTTDVEMLRSETPRDVLERAGFLSANAATDIASRLQIAFERILPKVRPFWAIVVVEYFMCFVGVTMPNRIDARNERARIGLYEGGMVW